MIGQRGALPAPISAIQSHNWLTAPAWLDARAVARRLHQQLQQAEIAVPLGNQIGKLLTAPAPVGLVDAQQAENGCESGDATPLAGLPESLISHATGPNLNENLPAACDVAEKEGMPGVTSPGPDDPMPNSPNCTVSLVVEGVAYSLRLSWSPSRKWFRYWLDCPRCGKPARGLHHFAPQSTKVSGNQTGDSEHDGELQGLPNPVGLFCRECLRGKRSPSRCPKVLRAVKQLTEYERKERQRRRTARIAGAQRYRLGQTVTLRPGPETAG